MKSHPTNACLYKIESGELSISGNALVELMTAVLAKGCEFRFRARGFSMSPFIYNGDVICVSAYNNSHPSVGQIVAYLQPATGKLVVHRLVKRQGGDWLITGDNTPQGDYDRIPRSNLIGKVTRIERNGKEVRLGLGPERYLIAMFLRMGTILPFLIKLTRTMKTSLSRLSQ